MSEVELHAAFVFDCEQCGKENFGRPVVREFDAETSEQMREEHGVEPWTDGDWIEFPGRVACQHCGRVFDVSNETI